MRSRGDLLTHIYSHTGGIVTVVLKDLMKRLRRDRRRLLHLNKDTVRQEKDNLTEQKS